MCTLDLQCLLFSNCLLKFGLKSVGDAPTNFDGRPSLIDLMISAKPYRFIAFNQIGSGLSNHDIVFATIEAPSFDLKSKPVPFRMYKAVNMEKLAYGISTSTLNDVFKCTTVKAMMVCFCDNMLKLLNDHVPLVTLPPKFDVHSTKNWYTADIGKAALDRDMAKRNLRKNNTSSNRKIYNALRNKVNQMILDEKNRFLEPRLHPSVEMKTLWRNVKSLGLVSAAQPAAPSFTADEFNIYL